MCNLPARADTQYPEPEPSIRAKMRLKKVCWDISSIKFESVSCCSGCQHQRIPESLSATMKRIIDSCHSVAIGMRVSYKAYTKYSFKIWLYLVTVSTCKATGKCIYRAMRIDPRFTRGCLHRFADVDRLILIY